MTSYSRQDVLRILQIGSRQLQGWERAELIAQQQSYSFQDLGQLRTLRVLREEAVPVASIRHSIVAMKAVAGMANPLLEASSGADRDTAGLPASRGDGGPHPPAVALRLRDGWKQGLGPVGQLRAVAAAPAGGESARACRRCFWRRCRPRRRARRTAPSSFTRR